MALNWDIDLTELECASSKKRKHFLINPTLLQCGHFLCFDCVESETTINKSVRCRICGEAKTINIKTNPASLSMDRQIKMNLNKLFDAVQKKFECELTKFKGAFRNIKESVELQFEYLKEEIEIRAESLKLEIDELCKNICEDLAVWKDKSLEEVETAYVKASDCQKVVNSYKDLKLIDKTTEKLNQLQSNLNSFSGLTKSLTKKKNEKLIELIPTQRCIDLELFTYINYKNTKSKNLIIPEEFKQKIPVTLKEFSFGDLCVFSKNQLLATDYLNECLCFYDRNLKLIKKKKIEWGKLAKFSFQPFGIAINGEGRIYVTDDTKKILMTDFAFNILSFVRLTHPTGLCFSNNLLYVCDFDTERIYTFESDLTFVELFQLDFAPWYIKVIDNTACIRHRYQDCISFYKLPNFSIKYRYYGHNGFICIVDTKFYEFYQPTSTIYCYNSNGTICDKRKIKLPKDTILSNLNPISYFGGKFVIATNISNEFIIP